MIFFKWIGIVTGLLCCQQLVACCKVNISGCSRVRKEGSFFFLALFPFTIGRQRLMSRKGKTFDYTWPCQSPRSKAIVEALVFFSNNRFQVSRVSGFVPEENLAYRHSQFV